MTDTKTPSSIPGSSQDVSAINRDKLKALFPGVFTETKSASGEVVESVDFERLKAEIGTFSDLFEGRRERYGMDWPGKKDSLKIIQSQSYATLKPVLQKHTDINKTENLFIEGDNLEVLKLLQKCYYNGVQMIYIDPPYNKGKDLIYPDNYSESLSTYLSYAGLLGDEGKKFTTNATSEGRFHTKWLNMLYPRLYLARNLLREDGLIFVSIDDNEVNNLRKLCDEVFGDENFIACLPSIMNLKGNPDAFGFADTHEYIIVYSKNKNLCKIGTFDVDETAIEDSWEEDDWGLYKRADTLRRTGQDASRFRRPNGWFPIFITSTDDVYVTENDLPKDPSDIVLWPKNDDEEELSWTWSKNKIISEPHNLLVVEGRSGKNIYKKQRPQIGELPTKKPKSLFYKPEYSTSTATTELKKLFSKKIFDGPKPVPLLADLVKIGAGFDGIVLDFFAGSGTTAHAVMAQNAEDGGNRRFICVQLPEPTDPESEAHKAGFKTIADITKERIRRAAAKLNEADQNAKKQDRGFRVLKLDKSNFKRWQKLGADATVEQISAQLDLHIEHVEPSATPEDLLFEILLKAGFRPTEKYSTVEIAGISVFSVAEGSLLVCLAPAVTRELVDAVSEAEPMQFVCLDSAFGGNDQLKANAAQTFAARNQGRDKARQIIFRTV